VFSFRFYAVPEDQILAALNFLVSAASGVKQKSTQLFAPDWFLKGSIDGDLLSKLLAHQFLLFSGQHQPESATAS
jgi:hypothetical protein